MGGGAINIGFGEDPRIVSGSLVYCLAVTASIGASGTWFDDTSGPRHECVDLSPGYATLAELRAATGWKVKALLSAVAEGPGDQFESLFNGLFGAAALASVQALDEADETRPITDRVFAYLGARAALEV